MEWSWATCLRILSRTRSISALGHGSISGALLSATHARVSSCRSRVSWGIAWPSTSARISSMSIDGANNVANNVALSK